MQNGRRCRFLLLNISDSASDQISAGMLMGNAFGCLRREQLQTKTKACLRTSTLPTSTSRPSRMTSLPTRSSSESEMVSTSESEMVTDHQNPIWEDREEVINDEEDDLLGDDPPPRIKTRVNVARKRITKRITRRRRRAGAIRREKSKAERSNLEARLRTSTNGVALALKAQKQLKTWKMNKSSKSFRGVSVDFSQSQSQQRATFGGGPLQRSSTSFSVVGVSSVSPSSPGPDEMNPDIHPDEQETGTPRAKASLDPERDPERVDPEASGWMPSSIPSATRGERVDPDRDPERDLQGPWPAAAGRSDVRGGGGGTDGTKTNSRGAPARSGPPPVPSAFPSADGPVVAHYAHLCCLYHQYHLLARQIYDVIASHFGWDAPSLESVLSAITFCDSTYHKGVVLQNSTYIGTRWGEISETVDKLLAKEELVRHNFRSNPDKDLLTENKQKYHTAQKAVQMDEFWNLLLALSIAFTPMNRLKHRLEFYVGFWLSFSCSSAGWRKRARSSSSTLFTYHACTRTHNRTRTRCRSCTRTCARACACTRYVRVHARVRVTSTSTCAYARVENHHFTFTFTCSCRKRN